MKNLLILEPPEGGISEILSHLLIRVKETGKTPPSFSIMGSSLLEKGASPNLLVVSARMKSFNNIEKLECDILLLPGISSGLASSVRAQYVVSYGMSLRDSITLSSMEKGLFMLSVQREIPTLDGSLLERQETLAHVSGRTTPEDVMAASAALLISGLPPELLDCSKTVRNAP